MCPHKAGINFRIIGSCVALRRQELSKAVRESNFCFKYSFGDILSSQLVLHIWCFLSLHIVFILYLCFRQTDELLVLGNNYMGEEEGELA